MPPPLAQRGEEKRAFLDSGVGKNVNVISNVGRDEVVCVFFLISYFMQGWAEDVAGMAYALRSLPEGAPCLPQVREPALGACPCGGLGGWSGPGGGRGREGLVPSKSESFLLNVFFPDHKWNCHPPNPDSLFSQLSLELYGTVQNVRMCTRLRLPAFC